MKTAFKYLWTIYSVLGAIWLTFTIISMGVFNQRDEHTVSGVVKEIRQYEWDGFKRTSAVIETTDGKGKVLVTLYRAGVEEGDEVVVDISTGGASGGFIHANISH